MIRYTATPEQDVLLAQWWGHLIHFGELEAVVPGRYAALGAFLGFCRGVRLYLEADANGPTVVCFGAPWCDGAMVGLWVRRDWRRTRRAYRAVMEALRELLAWSPLLVVLAPDARRKRLYEKIGVTFLDGWMPGLWQGQPAALGWLTAMTWQPWSGNGQGSVSRETEEVAHGRG
jgi:hypothetical protein